MPFVICIYTARWVFSFVETMTVWTYPYILEVYFYIFSITKPFAQSTFPYLYLLCPLFAPESPHHQYNSKVLHMCCIRSIEDDKMVNQQGNKIVKMRESCSDRVISLPPSSSAKRWMSIIPSPLAWVREAASMGSGWPTLGVGEATKPSLVPVQCIGTHASYCKQHPYALTHRT